MQILTFEEFYSLFYNFKFLRYFFVIGGDCNCLYYYCNPNNGDKIFVYTQDEENYYIATDLKQIINNFGLSGNILYCVYCYDFGFNKMYYKRFKNTFFIDNLL